MRYVLDVNGHEHEIQTIQELTERLENARQLPYADLALYQKLDKPPKWFETLLYRSLGLKPPDDNSHIAALVNSNAGLSLVTYVDEEDNTFYSANPDYIGAQEEKVIFILSNGQSDECLASECVAIEQALRAFISFFETGKQPKLFRWVKS
jgi:hypothetical protein